MKELGIKAKIQFRNSESGLIYLRARMYDAESGRFINEDPIKDGTNWYIYCNENPILFVDLFGLAPTEKEAAYISAHIYDYNQDSSKE
jgi:RHS repeat-associated protein